jgi:hypothetical protein
MILTNIALVKFHKLPVAICNADVVPSVLSNVIIIQFLDRIVLPKRVATAQLHGFVFLISSLFIQMQRLLSCFESLLLHASHTTTPI